MKGPHNAAAVRTPAARPDWRSYGESPTNTASCAFADRRSNASTTGAGCGLCSVVSSTVTIALKYSSNTHARSPRSVPCRPLLVTMASLTASRCRGGEGVLDAGIRPHALVVVGYVVRAIGADHGLYLSTVSCNLCELCPEWHSETRVPRVVGWHVALVCVQGVSSADEISVIESSRVPSTSNK